MGGTTIYGNPYLPAPLGGDRWKSPAKELGWELQHQSTDGNLVAWNTMFISHLVSPKPSKLWKKMVRKSARLCVYIYIYSYIYIYATYMQYNIYIYYTYIYIYYTYIYILYIYIYIYYTYIYYTYIYIHIYIYINPFFPCFVPCHLPKTPRHPAVLPHALRTASPAVRPQLLAADPAPLRHGERRGPGAAAATHGAIKCPVDPWWKKQMDQRKSWRSMLIHFFGQNVVDSLFFWLDVCESLRWLVKCWQNVWRIWWMLLRALPVHVNFAFGMLNEAFETGSTIDNVVAFSKMHSVPELVWPKNLATNHIHLDMMLWRRSGNLEAVTWVDTLFNCFCGTLKYHLTLKFSSDFLQNFRSHCRHIINFGCHICHQVEVFKIRTLDLQPWKTYPRPILEKKSLCSGAIGEKQWQLPSGNLT